jgi:BMFP domain-containing protein YqiC
MVLLEIREVTMDSKVFSAFSSFTERLTAIIPEDFERVRSDIRENVETVATSLLAELDLVTREEFDAQSKVLARTLQKMQQLEERVTALESAVL